MVLAKHSEQVYTDKMFDMTGRLIKINPDFYTLWNYRRELVGHRLAQRPGDAKDICAGEMQLSEMALRKNPKSYYAWHHRVWTIAKGQTDLKQEVALCTLYLSKDSRNFHCWNYRRYVMMLGRIQLADELAFSASKIDQNFSNYSAWHHRSFIIPKLVVKTTSAADARRAVDEEFELLKQAFFTEPEDQSAWMYHRWLLGRVVGLGRDLSEGMLDGGAARTEAKATAQNPLFRSSREDQVAVLRRELATVEELVDIEPDCKWALLTRAILLRGLRVRGEAVEGYLDTIRAIFDELLDLDPMRKQYYLDTRGIVLAGVPTGGEGGAAGAGEEVKKGKATESQGEEANGVSGS